MKNLIIALTILLFCSVSILAQNVAVSDDDAYTANSSAMLDVKSITKGFLAPRLTTAQRNAVVTPAAGLLVYDTTVGGYYYYNGSAWVNLSSGSASGLFWSYNSPNIYMTTSSDYLGIGTTGPQHKLHIYQSLTTTDGSDGVFADIQNYSNTNGTMSGIRLGTGTSGTPDVFKGAVFFQRYGSNNRGDLILANNTTASNTNVTAGDGRLVLQNDGRVMVKGDPNTDVNTAIFAVQNADGDTVFAVYPEGVRIWVNDDGLSKATGSRGGFAVGGFSPSKAGFTNEYLRVTPDSVRVYIDDSYTYSKTIGSRGGFAVGGFSPSKGTLTDHYLFVQDDSTRVYVADSLQGFGVENIEGADNQRIMRLTTDNYFIGHESGIFTTGKYNSFLGYKSGYSNTGGQENAFYGYKSGYSNIGGDYNIFIGNNAGYKNTYGDQNIMIGKDAGYENVSGDFNVFIGTRAGWKSNPVSGGNTFVGNQAGAQCPTAAFNSYFGWLAGTQCDGDYNTYVGTMSNFLTTSGDNNVAVGAASETDGSNNVVLGYSADATGNGNVAIGYGTSVSGSNKLAIDNSATASPLISGDFSSNYLTINGDHTITGTSTVNGTYFRMSNNPGTGATPAYYVYQGGTGSTSKQYAFSIYDALWTYGNSWLDGGITVGNGTQIDVVQSGTLNAGTNASGGVKTVTITFPTAFTGTPKINVTVRGGNFNDTFAITTRSISTTSVQVNIYRVDSPGGMWGQTLYLDWMAWRQ